MNKIMTLLVSMTLLLLSLTATTANAGINVFTDHQLIHIANGRVHNPDAQTGKLPYLGRIGLEYQHPNNQHLTYSLAYIHRSNADLIGYEYRYDGVSVGVKLHKCIIGC